MCIQFAIPFEAIHMAHEHRQNTIQYLNIYGQKLELIKALKVLNEVFTIGHM